MTDLSTLPDKALSIRQPWVWAILNAGKDIENRPRRFNYRGPICLHASLYKQKKIEFDTFVDLARLMSQADNWAGPWIPFPDEMERGGIIGTAEIVDCVDHSDSPWFFGPYGLVLRNIQPVPFIPVKGALGLFNWKKNLTGGIE